MLEKLKELYESFGEFDYRSLESLKICLGNKFINNGDIDYDTMNGVAK